MTSIVEKIVEPQGPAFEDGSVETDIDIDKGGTVTMYSLGHKTPEEVFAGTGLDPAHWHIANVKTGTYDGPMKIKEGGVERVGIVRGHKTAITIKPSGPSWLINGLELIHKRAESFTHDYSTLPLYDRVDDGQRTLCVVGLFDTHFGQYAWSGETGENNDLDIIEARYRSVIDRIVRKCLRENVTDLLFPVGQDFLHVDNPKHETLRGTGQDVDTRYAKVVDRGFDALRYAIEQFARVGKLQVTYSAGNHDRTVSFHLTRELAAWFRTATNVEFDYQWIKRKYFQYGKNAIGICHGDTEPWTRLISDMGEQCKAFWPEVDYKAYFMGHYHHKKRRPAFEIEDKQGTVFHQVASLSGRDAYHYEMAYHSNRAGEIFLLAHDASEQGNWTFVA